MEQKKTCPICHNHCTEDATECEKGQEFFGKETKQINRIITPGSLKAMENMVAAIIMEAMENMVTAIIMKAAENMVMVTTMGAVKRSPETA